MSSFTVATLSMLLAGSLLQGCAEAHCSDPNNKNDPACKPKVDMSLVNLSVFPRRLNIQEDITITVAMGTKTHATDEVKITQPGATEYSLTPLGTGNLKVTKDELKRKGFRPGLASLVIGANPPESIRFSLLPDYMRAIPDINTTNGADVEVPLWVGICSNQIIATLNSTKPTLPPVKHVEYGGLTRALKWQGNTNYPNNIRASAILSQKYVGFSNASSITKAIMLQECPLSIDNCNKIQTAQTTISDLSINRKGTLLGAILDNQLFAYSVDKSFNDTTPQTVISGITSPRLVGSDDIDGDGLADFVVWDDKAISVLLQSNTNGLFGFAINNDLSSQLTVALGTDKPTALFVDDADGDGLEDVFYTTTQQIAWLLNQGIDQDGKMKFKKGGVLNTLEDIDSFAIGDIDIDSLAKNDIAIANKAGMKIIRFINQAAP